MTTRPTAQPEGARPEPDEPGNDADLEPARSAARATAVAVIPFLLLGLGLGVRTFILAKRARSQSDGNSSRSAPYSGIRIAAAPHSTVHVVSAPCLGHSHVQIPTRLAASSPASLSRQPRGGAALRQRRGACATR
jgi:hypothetical protein